MGCVLHKVKDAYMEITLLGLWLSPIKKRQAVIEKSEIS